MARGAQDLDLIDLRDTEPAVLEALVVTDTPETAHIDEQLVAVARASAAEVEVVPEEATQLELALGDLESRPEATPHVPLWARLVADPGFAAEHAAREAVDRLGPEARDWLARTRTRYPSAGRAGLARLATEESIRSARRQGAASGAAGALGSAVATGMLARGHARLVLSIAAAYGFDPTAHERGRDLLVVLRVPRLTQPAPAVPFGAAIAGATIGARSTRDVADRAVAHYRSSAPYKKPRGSESSA